MIRFPGMPVAALLVLLASATASAQVDPGAIRGVLTDGSDAALPGVSVTAATADGRVIATAVTDATGSYVLGGLPPGQLRVTFQLDGFAAQVVSVTVQPTGVAVVGKRLELAPVTETVVVVGKASDVTAASHRLPPPPEITPVAQHDRDSVCGPAKPAATPESFGTIRSRREAAERELYSADDELVIEGGILDGLEVGQNFVVRRTFRVTNDDGTAMHGEHTAGVLQIVAAQDHASRAVVVYACDEMMKGDFLASFKPEPLRAPDPMGIPAYDAAARILFADAGHLLGAPRRLMVIDRGSWHGLHVGQRVTLFRRRGHRGSKPSVIGDAVVVAIRDDSATIRIENAIDVIASGDWAAPQRTSAASAVAGNGGAKHP